MAYVFNHDIAGIIRRLDRFTYEVLKSVSSNVTAVNQFDRDRLISYLTGLTTYHNWVVAQPQLDLPATTPTKYTLPGKPPLPKLHDEGEPEVENDAVIDVANLMELMRGEMINSQSARMPSGLLSYDSERLMAIVKKCETFVTAYIDPVMPTDLPESTPKVEDSGTGRLGINPITAGNS